MVSVDKFCCCVNLRTGAIVLGCISSFQSLFLVLVCGGFLLNYDNFIKLHFQKGAQGDVDSEKLAKFLETYKDGNKLSRYFFAIIFFIKEQSF